MTLSFSRMRFRAFSFVKSASSSRLRREWFDLEMAGDFPFLARSRLRSDLSDGASSSGEEASEDDTVIPSRGAGRISSITGPKQAPAFSRAGGAVWSGFTGRTGGGIGGGSGSVAFEEFLVFLDLDLGAIAVRCCKEVGNI